MDRPYHEEEKLRVEVLSRQGYDQCILHGAKPMTVQAFVEQLGARRYRVSITQPLALCAEGDSREEAVERLCQLARERLAAGELMPIDLSAESQANPWVESAGTWKDHPDLDEYVRNIRAYREQADKLQSGS
jgi:hypothetical protein